MRLSAFRPTVIVMATAVGALGLQSAVAQASSRPHVSVAPKRIVAGDALTVKLTGGRGQRCVLSIRADHRGALVKLQRRIGRGSTSVTISSSSAAGPRVAVVRCGSHAASARFSVSSALSGSQTPTGLAAPVAPTPDAQGFVPGTAGSQAEVDPNAQYGGGVYDNSRIADIALSQLGRNLYTAGPLDHGQCKQAVNDWVAASSGGTQRMGVDYYSNYARNGGQQISRDDAVKGDIIQLDNPGDIFNYYRGMHTAVVVSHTPGSESFDVVDSNFRLDDTVREHAWNPYQSGRTYGLRVTIWRMGTASSAPTPQPQPQPTPPPATAPPTTFAETVGGNANTWTNYTNAGGSQGPTIPSNLTVAIACKVGGFRVADGNTWWYRIASNPWNNTYYVSADAFYNNGQTSGSLHGTPFVDPNVPNC